MFTMVCLQPLLTQSPTNAVRNGPPRVPETEAASYHHGFNVSSASPRKGALQALQDEDRMNTITDHPSLEGPSRIAHTRPPGRAPETNTENSEIQSHCASLGVTLRRINLRPLRITMPSPRCQPDLNAKTHRRTFAGTPRVTNEWCGDARKVRRVSDGTARAICLNAAHSARIPLIGLPPSSVVLRRHAAEHSQARP